MLIEGKLDSVKKLPEYVMVYDFICTDLDIAIPSWEMLEKA